MSTVLDWSQTASANDVSDASINWVEGQAASTVNNSARALMAQIAKWLSDQGAGKRTTAGSGNAYTITNDAAGASYQNGEIIAMVLDRANTGATTLNSNARGAIAFRPVTGVDHNSGDLKAGQAVLAHYRSSSNEFLSIGSGYAVSSTAAGLSVQSVVGRMPQIGDAVISIDSAGPATGRIRLTEATQSLLKTAWPELNTWLSARSYPWGSTATNFSLPPAAGYYFRVAATTAAIDTSGARTAGSTQSDQNKTASVPASGLTAASTSTSNSTVTLGTIGGTGSGGSGGTSGATVPSGAAVIVVTTSTSTSTTVGGSATLPGGDEVRVKNVAFHLDIVASTSTVSASNAVLGYTAGAGGTVTQATSKSTGVTLSTPSGVITMNAASLADGSASSARVSFTLTNSLIAVNDTIVVNHASAGTAGAYHVSANGITGGSAQITVRNISGGALAEGLVLNFALVRAAAS